MIVVTVYRLYIEAWGAQAGRERAKVRNWEREGGDWRMTRRRERERERRERGGGREKERESR